MNTCGVCGSATAKRKHVINTDISSVIRNLLK